MHIVQFSGTGRASDTFCGTVVESTVPFAPMVGQYSDRWSRDQYDVIDWQAVSAEPIPLDTVESLQAENEALRLALGVDIEPLATLPERMVARANGLRKLYEKVKDAVDAHR